MSYPFESEIKKAAGKHDLDPNLVAALCWKESTFQPEVSRYEKRFFRKYVDHNPDYAALDPELKTTLATSMGIIQVMGATAHEDGLPLDRLKDLFQLEVGLEYGCKQLEQLFQRYWQSPIKSLITNVVSAYNAGSARKRKDGKYTNQEDYVDKVMAKYREFKGGGAHGTEGKG